MKGKPLAWIGVALAVAATIGKASDELGPVAETFCSYEKIRALLADDKIEGVSMEAARLVKAATKALEQVQDPLKARFEAISQGAGKLKDAKELKQARLDFGNVSRELVEAIRKEP